MGVSLYDILGVPDSATQDQIKSAYRQKALEHHPDRYRRNFPASCHGIVCRARICSAGDVYNHGCLAGILEAALTRFVRSQMPTRCCSCQLCMYRSCRTVGQELSEAIHLGSATQVVPASAPHGRQLVVRASSRLIILCSVRREIALLLQVLRDAGRRSSYDALRSGYGGFEGTSSSGAYEANWRPGTDNFDEFFNNWWQRQG